MIKLILIICATVCWGLEAFGATWKVNFGWLGMTLFGISMLV